MKNAELTRDEAAWEAWLAEGWRAAAEPEAETAEESAAFARRLDGMLRREREERRAWRARWT
ncbi:MAG: hypothetical protein IK066_03800, partial [Kiritimatiellae bacterium]|nr:hypothetical protein [Kiritimatiellia bacterium]